MADPRNVIDHEGIGYQARTFIIDGSTIAFDATLTNGSSKVGLAVRLKPGSDQTIETVGDGEAVLGKLIKVETGGFATVQTSGCMTLKKGSAATLTLGKKIVGAVLVAAEGYIREVATGTAAELGVARGFIEASTGVADGGDVAVWLD